MRGSCVPRRGVLARHALPVMSLARNPEGARELSVSRQMWQRYAWEQAAKRKKAEADAAVSRVPSVDSRVADASVEAWRTFKLYLGMLTRECASCVACGIPWSMKDTELMLPFLRMSIKLAINHNVADHTLIWQYRTSGCVSRQQQTDASRSVTLRQQRAPASNLGRLATKYTDERFQPERLYSRPRLFVRWILGNRSLVV